LDFISSVNTLLVLYVNDEKMKRNSKSIMGQNLLILFENTKMQSSM